MTSKQPADRRNNLHYKSEKYRESFSALASSLRRLHLGVFLFIAMLPHVGRLPAERRMLAGKPEKDRESVHVLQQVQLVRDCRSG